MTWDGIIRKPEDLDHGSQLPQAVWDELDLYIAAVASGMPPAITVPLASFSTNKYLRAPAELPTPPEFLEKLAARCRYYGNFDIVCKLFGLHCAMFAKLPEGLEFTNNCDLISGCRNAGIQARPNRVVSPRFMFDMLIVEPFQLAIMIGSWRALLEEVENCCRKALTENSGSVRGQLEFPRLDIKLDKYVGEAVAYAAWAADFVPAEVAVV